jgi:uncharacterized phage protein (TIGR01671 family)
MNREIRFRAWDKKRKKMIYQDFWGRKEQEWSYWGDCIMSDNNYIKMQYTGLKDKNGKEIYEGDIVSDEEDTGYISYMSETTEYIIDYWKKGDETSRGENLSSVGEVEIIGNIYENPNLIK